MKYLLTALTGLILINLSTAQIVTQTNFLDGSDIIDIEDQRFVLEALPSQFHFEAELAYSTEDADLHYSSFHAACDGLSNTLIVAKSQEGYVFGGYNEGTWSSDDLTQEGLDNNFIFSVPLQEIYTALPGAVHITNNSAACPVFGTSNDGDLRFFSDNGSSVLINNELGNSYTCPSPTVCDCRTNNNTCASGFNTRFRATAFEVWQLKSSGTAAFAIAVDYNEDGIPETTATCLDQTSPVFPASLILNRSQDALLASWLPQDFLFEASPLYASGNANFPQQGFLNNVAGFYNTLIIIRTEDGQIIGGYNEGFWSGSNSTQSNLTDNFIFNMTQKRKHDALIGEVHVTTGSEVTFGAYDLQLTFGQSEHYTEFDHYNSTSSSLENTGNYDYLTLEEYFTIDRIEVWLLNQTGEAIFLPVDEDNNGICDHLDINNYITVDSNQCLGDLDDSGFVTAGDLTIFLTVFGSECD